MVLCGPYGTFVMTEMLATLPYPHLDPVMFRLGPVAVRWYGVAYLLGFLLGYAWLRRMSRRGELRLSLDQLGSLVTWVVVGVLLGGRLGWWLFYHRHEGAEPWYEPIATWHGGMSFHGALLGVVLVMLIWSRINRISMSNVTDCAALVAPVGLFFGRLANFINAELVGRVSNVPWAMVFPGETVARHPSQLYEAILEGPVLLAVVWSVRRFRPREGRIAAAFLVFYGLFRFLVEFTRQPDAQLGFIALGWLTMGQILSLVLVMIGVIWFAFPAPPAPVPPPPGPLDRAPATGSAR